MSSTAPPPYGPPGGTAPQPGGASSSFFDSLRRIGIVRAQDRWVGGVASGVARKLGVDPLVVRGVLVVLALFGGLTLVLYGVAWALLPEESDGRIHLQEAIRGRFDAALAGAAAFVLVGIARPAFWFSPDRWAPGWLVAIAWLGVIATIGVLALMVSSRKDAPHPSFPPPAPGAGTPTDQTGTSMSTPPPPGAPDAAPHDGPSDGPQPGTGPSAASATTDAPPPYPSPAAAPYPYPSAYPPPTSAYPSSSAYQAPSAYQPSPGYQPSPAYQPPSVQQRAAGVDTAPPEWQPPAPRPRTEGPGTVTVGIVLALCLFAGAAILVAHRTGGLTGSAALTITGVTLALLGLGVLLSGARGRRSGVLGGLAVLVALLAVPAAALYTAAPDWNRLVSSGGSVIATDVVWAPTSVEQAEAGYGFGVGSARIDLTGVPLDDARTVAVGIDAGAGSTTVVVPTGVPVEVRTELGAGEIRSVLLGDWERELRSGIQRGGWTNGPDAGFDGSARFARTEVAGTNLDLLLRSPTAGPAQLVVTIDAGFGDVTIEEAQS